ncbi:translation initiation factor IF-2-like [Mustela putorius furo]|uniref:Translation initiation factor IF-2-like n=1 Tax=Mustela putorius furo TaxID=9669 RepID=A0A8U0RFH3_MUSPF|nr:translation initiation factor IF-2-like [Mustela putorius furo]
MSEKGQDRVLGCSQEATASWRCSVKLWSVGKGEQYMQMRRQGTVDTHSGLSPPLLFVKPSPSQGFLLSSSARLALQLGQAVCTWFRTTGADSSPPLPAPTPLAAATLLAPLGRGAWGVPRAGPAPPCSPLAGGPEERGGGVGLWRLAPGKVGQGARGAAGGRAGTQRAPRRHSGCCSGYRSGGGSGGDWARPQPLPPARAPCVPPRPAACGARAPRALPRALGPRQPRRRAGRARGGGRCAADCAGGGRRALARARARRVRLGGAVGGGRAGGGRGLGRGRRGRAEEGAGAVLGGRRALREPAHLGRRVWRVWPGQRREPLLQHVRRLALLLGRLLGRRTRAPRSPAASWRPQESDEDEASAG